MCDGYVDALIDLMQQNSRKDYRYYLRIFGAKVLRLWLIGWGLMCIDIIFGRSDGSVGSIAAVLIMTSPFAIVFGAISLYLNKPLYRQLLQDPWR